MFIVKRVYIKIEISCLSFKNLDHLEAVDLRFHMTTKSWTGKWLPLWLAHELSWSWCPPSPFLTFQTHVVMCLASVRIWNCTVWGMCLFLHYVRIMKPMWWSCDNEMKIIWHKTYLTNITSFLGQIVCKNDHSYSLSHSIPLSIWCCKFSHQEVSLFPHFLDLDSLVPCNLSQQDAVEVTLCQF